MLVALVYDNTSTVRVSQDDIYPTTYYFQVTEEEEGPLRSIGSCKRIHPPMNYCMREFALTPQLASVLEHHCGWVTWIGKSESFTQPGKRYCTVLWVNVRIHKQVMPCPGPSCNLTEHPGEDDVEKAFGPIVQLGPPPSEDGFRGSERYKFGAPLASGPWIEFRTW